MSEMVPPAHTSGVAAKHPPMKRKASCAPMLGERADAITKIMYNTRVTMYTGLRPRVSLKGPANRAPTPNPVKEGSQSARILDAWSRQRGNAASSVDWSTHL